MDDNDHAGTQNNSGEIIPPRAAMKITSYTDGFFVVDKPDADNLTQVLFNGPVAVPVGGRGTATIGPICPAGIESGGTTTPGTTYGTADGEWDLAEGGSGFLCLGEAPGTLARGADLVWMRPFSAGGWKGLSFTGDVSQWYIIPDNSVGYPHYSTWLTLPYTGDPFSTAEADIYIGTEGAGGIFELSMDIRNPVSSGSINVNMKVQLGNAAGTVIYTSDHWLGLTSYYSTTYPAASAVTNWACPRFSREIGAPAGAQELHKIRVSILGSGNKTDDLYYSFAANLSGTAKIFTGTSFG